MATTITSDSVSLGRLLSNSDICYTVPSFQRDYSWTTSQVGELWDDIITVLNESYDEHFMGAIVINNSEKPYQIIDGQQRLATISFLICALCNIAKQHGDSELSSEISRAYLGMKDFRTRKIEPRLSLNAKNNDFYKEYILEHKDINEIKKQGGKRSEIKSNRLIAEAYSFLYEKVQNRITEIGDVQEALIQIEECIKEKCISIVIFVPDEANAYLIFETLNDRGLDLSVADLLKNYLFSKATNKLDEVQRKWTEISQSVGKFELTKFIRHYWLSNYELVREKELYKALKRKIKNQADVISFSNKLTRASEFYGAFEDPQSSVWAAYDSAFRENLSQLILLEVSSCYSVLLAAVETLPQDLFSKVLRMLLIISFRYNTICALNPNPLERIYSDTAIFIRENKPTSPKAIFEKLSSAYPDDETFRQFFEEKSVGKSKLARYIMTQINNYYIESRELITNPNEKQVNLEHILPEKPKDNSWFSNFPNDIIGDYTYRLGNLTLLESGPNREQGNLPFKDKLSNYSKSSLEITKKLAEFQDWTPQAIEDRQKRMAKVACHVWRLDYST